MEASPENYTWHRASEGSDLRWHAARRGEHATLCGLPLSEVPVNPLADPPWLHPSCDSCQTVDPACFEVPH